MTDAWEQIRMNEASAREMERKMRHAERQHAEAAMWLDLGFSIGFAGESAVMYAAFNPDPRVLENAVTHRGRMWDLAAVAFAHAADTGQRRGAD